MARGDHLFVECCGYSHHGIDGGDGLVIHFNSTPWRKLTGTVVPQRAPRICEVTIDQFALGRPIQVVPYEASDDVETVIGRARACLGHTGYRLFHNNCEHFAVWCKTGQPWSSQVAAATTAAQLLQRAVPAALLAWRCARRWPTPARSSILAAVTLYHVGRSVYAYAACRRSSTARGES